MSADSPLVPWRGMVVIYGPAATQGSKTTFLKEGISKKTGRPYKFPVMLDDNKNLKPWRSQAVAEMREVRPDAPLDEAMFARITVYVKRPAAHFRTNGELKPTAPKYPKVGKDHDKIARACFDAMKIGGWVSDDSRFADLHIKRRYDSEERVVIEACELDVDVANSVEEQTALFQLSGEGPRKPRPKMEEPPPWRKEG